MSRPPARSTWLLLLVLCGAQNLTARQSLLAIRDATLVDVVTGGLTPASLILIRGSRIERIGRTDQMEIPEGASVLEAGGRYLIPGLIDMHVHYNDWVPELYLNHGVTSVRDMANQIAWITSVKWARDAGLLDLQGVDWMSRSGPRIFVAGVVNTHPRGQSHHYQATSLEAARRAVGWMVEAGADAGLKLHRGISLPMLQAVCQEAGRRGVKVTAHLPDSISVHQGVLAGLNGIEHALDLPQRPRQQALETVRLMTQKGVYWTPTILNKWKDVIGIAAQDSAHVRQLLQHPGLSYLPEMRRKVLQALYPAGGKTLVKEGERGAQLQQLFELVKTYVEGGGRLLAGSDSPAHHLAGFSLHQELALFVEEAGLTPLQALQSATIHPAAYLGLTDLGRVEVGARADLLLLEGNPLEQIRNTRRISTVILDGRPVSRDYHAHFVPLLRRPVMPHSRVFYGQELLKAEHQ